MPQSPKPIRVFFNQGVQKPAKLGTVILKPASDGKLSYAQNVRSDGLEYGEGVLVPGPALVTLADNAELTGVPIAKAYQPANGFIYFIEGALGATNKIRRVKNVTDGSTPAMDTTGDFTAAHSAHSSVVLHDMAVRDKVGAENVYVIGKDATDMWIQAFTGSDASPAFSVTQVLTQSVADYLLRLYPASDGLLYIFLGNLVGTYDPTTPTYTALAYTAPVGHNTTEVAEWNGLMAIAYAHFTNNTPKNPFDLRKDAISSGILLWDMVSTTTFVRDVSSPARFISAIVNKPDGDLVVFGSLDAGMTGIYIFTGYGFQRIYSYIGEPPRNRHAVEFDINGNMLWQTLDGEHCSFNFDTKQFHHFASADCTADHAGIFGRLLGDSGNEFITASGTDDDTDTFNISRITFGSYIGDGDADPDETKTPLAISGLQFLPPASTITAITLHLTKNLATSEKLTLRLYKNGSTSPSDYFDMEFAVDGAISSKRKALPVRNVHNFALGVVWKQTDALATAPPVVFAEVEWTPTIN